MRARRPQHVLPADVPQTWEELGLLLVALRGDRSVDHLVASQPEGPRHPHITRSTFYRYEAATSRPHPDIADHLDSIYEGDTLVAASIRSLWRARWNPWRRGEAVLTREHAAAWPAAYSGQVWIKIVPAAHQAPTSHRIRLSWGPWRQQLDITLNESGVVLATSKAEDKGPAVTMNLRSDRPVFTLSGLGEDLEGENVLDVRDGWSSDPWPNP